jgi:hypothetical protein
MLHTLAIVNENFKLNLEDEIQRLDLDVAKLKAMHIDLIEGPLKKQQ